MNNRSGSVGLVQSQAMHFNEPLRLVCGRTLKSYTLAYETYGRLNQEKNNAVLVCHALSGNQHAAGYLYPSDHKPGWWETCIGPGKPIDTEKFFVVCSNNLGGCHGSSGPNTVNPETGQRWGPDFPIVTVEDWVCSQKRLQDALGIEQWAAVVGGSLGGMQALQWSITYPQAVRNAVLIACAPKLSAQNIAFNEIARQAILSDPQFHQGRYYERGEFPKRGLTLARMLGHITYLSDHAMRLKFDRELKSGQLKYDYDVEFQVESYLRYQGEVFSENFDANTYLLMTRALDYFDPASACGNQLARALEPAQSRFLVLSFTTDWRFSPARSQEITNALIAAKKPVSYAQIEARQGHDSFLLKVPRYLKLFKTYMDGVADGNS